MQVVSAMKYEITDFGNSFFPHHNEIAFLLDGQCNKALEQQELTSSLNTLTFHCEAGCSKQKLPRGPCGKRLY